MEVGTWLKYPEHKPTKYIKYLVYRSKCNKTHFAKWNGLQWAYDDNVITHFCEINLPNE